MAANAKRVGSKTAATPRHLRRREEFLAAAAGVFAEKGYHGASMRDIAARLGVRQAAIYYYFPSKARILEAICRHGIAEFGERMAAIRSLKAPPEEKIRRALAAHLEPMVERHFYVHAFLFLRRALPTEARRPLDRAARAYEAHWRALVDAGKRAGTIPATLDARLAVLAILGMCNTVARWSRHAAALDADRIVAAYTRNAARGLFGP